MTTPKTLFEKIWETHLVREAAGEPALLYIDLHLVHEVTSPQAFEGLRLTGRKVRRPDLTVATMDHNVPTWARNLPVTDEISKQQMDALASNCKEFGVPLYDLDSDKQGIVHVIGPELGLTQPGMTIVCGDSHTSTHGAFGALAFGIGTSEVEHVLATQTLQQARPKTMEVRIDGHLPAGVTAKDIILGVIGRIGTAGGTGYVIEYTGQAIRDLSMEGRMTVCNMSIEAGARAGMIAPDQKTFDYVAGRPHAPSGKDLERAVAEWRRLPTDEGATYDRTEVFNGADLTPFVTWGTNPGMVAPISGRVPDPSSAHDEGERRATERALEYMGLTPGTLIEEIPIDRVFLGSCTNGRIEDLRDAAAVIKGRKVNPRVYAMVVPGSMPVKVQAEAEGLHEIFIAAGFDWRTAGCSMCLGMNPDILKPGERCASTSNRNFEGRQGKGGRTHLVSPQMAAARQSPDTLWTYAPGRRLPDQTPLREHKEHVLMQPFTTLSGVAAPLDRVNVDTDQIIPKQFLKRIERTGFGPFCFFDWRYNDDGSLNPDFELNQPEYQTASILVAGRNFGCGSSREHAPWALEDMGIRVVLAPSFADIFFNNCFKNGMLPVVLPESVIEDLLARAKERPGYALTIDLENQVVSDQEGVVASFDVDPFRKDCLIRGLDDIGLTMQHEPDITKFESSRNTSFPTTPVLA